MDKKILAKIKKAKILTEDELKSLETSIEPKEETKSPKDEVSDTMEAMEEPKEETPTMGEEEPSTEEPATPPVSEPAMEEPPMGEPEGEEPMMEAPTLEAPMPPTDLPAMGEPGMEEGAPMGEMTKAPVAETGETTAVSLGDLDQVKTTISTLENKIRSLEEVISKLSVVGEPTQEDFGISGKGKTVAGGEPMDDKVGAMIKKMGGFSK